MFLRKLITTTLLLNLFIFSASLVSVAQDGCTDSYACNYDASAVNDDGSCTYSGIFIPWNPGDGPAIQACTNPFPGSYYLGNQSCLEIQIVQDPYCVTTNWDNICQSDYEDCIGCDDPVWCIPFDIASGPALQGCPDNIPAGYYMAADQACAITVLQSDGYCIYNSWDYLCQNAYDNCALGCNGRWFIPIVPGTNPPIYACDRPTGYMDFPAEQQCIEQTIALYPDCLVNGWDDICDAAFDMCAFGCSEANWYLPYDPENLEPVYDCSAPGEYYLADEQCIQNAYTSSPNDQCLTEGFSPVCEFLYNNCMYGCQSPSYWIPYVLNSLPIVISCTNPGSEYYEADTECLETVFITYLDEPYTMWTDEHQTYYDTCTIGCIWAKWYLPIDVEASNLPAVYACGRPGGYWLPDQVCVTYVLANDNDQANVDWDVYGQTLYNQCALGCDEAFWFLPVNVGVDPAVLACEAPEGYEMPIDYECALETIINDGFCTVSFWDFLCNEAYLECASIGCTYEWACNYSPLASEDDGSCGKAGCTDIEAINYENDAVCDDGSCVYQSSCEADFNNNGEVDAGDLLTFLSSFGVSCE